MRATISLCALALAAAPALATQPLTVMSYNILHGQPCAGGGLGSEVAPRMELAVRGEPGCRQGTPGCAPGLVTLAPDILGMQEVSQVFVDQSVGENQACLVLAQLPPPIGGLPPGIAEVEAYEHAADYLVRRMNGVRAALAGSKNKRLKPEASPYKMRFVRDNPRLLPLLPDIPLPPDDQALSDISADLSDLEIGLAVISRFRIQQVTVHNLTIGLVPGETRAILHATIRVPHPVTGVETPHDFYDSHLTTTGGDSPQTILMSTEIIRFILTSRRFPENPGFFTCDCNFVEGELDDPPALDGPRSYQLFRNAGFVDTFRAANPSNPGPTSGRDGLGTSCDEFANPPGRRIDYVWAIPSVPGGVIPEILSSEVVMNYSNELAPGVCRWPSDHNGVITEFDLENLVPANP